jgi:dipeptidyl-peptidase III
VSETRQYLLERIDDAAVVQVYADGFRTLSLNDKILVWHLYLAALAGRDIFYDQRHRSNLEIRELLETILQHAEHVEGEVLAEVRRYTKLFWINTGPFNNLTARKFVLNLTRDQLTAAMHGATRAGAIFADAPEVLLDRLSPMLFDAAHDAVVTNKTPADGRDMLEASSNNLYVGVRMSDVANFTERYGLNSRLVRRGSQLIEEVYRVGGRYDAQIREVVRHLHDAIPYAPPGLAASLRALIRFYETGEERDRLAYDIAWVSDQDSPVDTINGFIEVYMDPRGVKGSWEALVYIVNEEKTHKIETLAANAQWFEDHMPFDARYRKSNVLGVTAKAIEVVFETGDSGPLTPIGINLPNDQKIREQYGSKSVSLFNINEAYEESTPEGMRTEFSWTAEEAARAKRWGAFALEVGTEIHEVIGHGSGRMADGVASPHLLLKEQYSAIEESRADLIALYFVADPKLAELGIVRAEDHEEIIQTAFEYYARNALVQLRRIREGTTIEEDHMRNRQMIVAWLVAQTKAIDVRRRDGKTYYVMTDAVAFREGVGHLLAEVQRIKSEGDYAAARALFDRYGIHIDPSLRDEVVARVDALHLPSYTAIVMPRLTPTYRGGEIVDVEISYPCDLETQMLEFSRLRNELRRGGPPAADALATPAASR